MMSIFSHCYLKFWCMSLEEWGEVRKSNLNFACISPHKFYHKLCSVAFRITSLFWCNVRRRLLINFVTVAQSLYVFLFYCLAIIDSSSSLQGFALLQCSDETAFIWHSMILVNWIIWIISLFLIRLDFWVDDHWPHRNLRFPPPGIDY